MTCLELASGTGLPKRAGDSEAGKGTSSATQEPSPAQRTNPIEVLNKGR